ncbi:MAG: hypothetical protein JXM79_11960 [Sedimentisphaerales bacterium]|nr:hypothetical protein [Sedimentisphaerales bacterium]
MNLPKLISLLVGVLYIITLVFLIMMDRDHASKQEVFERLFYVVGGMLVWLGLSLACIWWGDELGEGLIGAKFGLISSMSSGWLVKFVGWVLLLVPIIVVVLMSKNDN